MSSQPPEPDAPEKRSLKALALRAASWTVGGQALAQGLRLLSNIILARLLFPEAFGLMAIVWVFMYGLNMFSDLGVGPSIVYNRHGEEPQFLNTAWTIQVIRGVLITLGAALLAWPVSEIYDAPELFSLLAATGCVGLIQGFDSTAIHTQQRQLELGPVIRIEVISQLVTIVVMVIWALLIPTVWALVGGTLVGTVVRTILSHFYLPRFPHRLQWDAKAAKAIYSYGSWIFLSSIFTFIGVQGDRLLLGYYLPIATLGVYSVATRFSDAITNLQTRLAHSVFFPLFSETARSEPELLVGRYYRIRLWMDLLFLSASGLLASTGHVLIDVLYDERYVEAGWILQALAIQVGMSAVLTSEETLLFSLGKTYYSFARSFARALWIVAGIPLSWHFGGLRGVVLCVAFSELPVLAVIWVGMVKQNALRPLLELRSLLIWGASFSVGLLLEAAIG
jgi:O-antigen/teichoic acid export membrane protein